MQVRTNTHAWNAALVLSLQSKANSLQNSMAEPHQRVEITHRTLEKWIFLMAGPPNTL